MWRTVGTVPWISTLSSVSIAWMGTDHLILFGSNNDQDGAIIVAYNIILGVGTCRYPMKMYSEHAKLYCFNGRIILEASNHIGMLPYVLETNRNLSSLLGSHDIIEDSNTEIADWDTPTEPTFKVVAEIKDLLKLGLTERAMCAQLLPLLLEKEDGTPVYKLVKEFQDVPESMLVLLLNYTIKLLKPDDVDITDQEAFTNFVLGCGKSNLELMKHRGKVKLLNHLFKISFSDALLIPFLRNGLSLDNALFLMSYISCLLMDSKQNLNIEYESKLYDWCILLMDAFYQQYLLTKDEKVSNVLQTMQEVVENLIGQLMSIDSTMALLQKILSGKKMVEQEESLSYAIELIEI